jgi:hypothetical protein
VSHKAQRENKNMNENTVVIIASNPDNLAAAIAGKKSATVEAEYGAVTVPGSLATLAHHGANSGNPAPCSQPNSIACDLDVVGVSHLDLDTVGGIWALMGNKPEMPGFWALAEYVDLNGAHKLSLSGASEQDVARLYAWWAWNESHKTFPPRDGSCLDCTAAVTQALCALESILRDDTEMLAAGEAFRAAEARLESESFVAREGDVLVRSSENFTNHLYTHDGSPASAVVGYSQKFKSITVSFASPRDCDNACAFVQALWGPLAGGHKGIAGSPRGTEYTLDDAREVARKLAATL